MKFFKQIYLLLRKEFTSIGGQAVIEGVMMRSPNSFVVAVRTPEGKIRLRKDQWYSFSKKLPIFKLPFFRGVLILIETMANGIVALNYSANIAIQAEEKEKQLKKGLTLEEIEEKQKKSEKVSIGTFFTIAFSLIFGLGLFVALPHFVTYFVNKYMSLHLGLNTIGFHLIDGSVKACIFILYIFLIGLLPDVKRVFQYHGAEHKSISTFEKGLELSVEKALPFSTFHPRCGTTFIFFLIFISIVLFAAIFLFLPIPSGVHPIVKQLIAIGYKFLLSFPIAGIAFELIKWSGKYSHTFLGKIISTPGMWLQRLTTNEPDKEQLEVGLASLKMVLILEEKYNLKNVNSKVLTLEEVEVDSIEDIEASSFKLKDFIE